MISNLSQAKKMAWQELSPAKDFLLGDVMEQQTQLASEKARHWVRVTPKVLLLVWVQPIDLAVAGASALTGRLTRPKVW